jgi:ribose 5-phosphate isomerase B
MKIYFATDHAGYELKNQLVSYVRDELGYEIEDCGALHLDEDDDYPDFVKAAARKVATAPTKAKAIILGASGQGEAIVANRFLGVRAVVYYGAPAEKQTDSSKRELTMVESTREHNDANILSLGARFIELEEAKSVVSRWLETAFNEDVRHARRIKKIDGV